MDEEALLKVGAIMLFYVAVIGVMTTITSWAEHRREWLCYCGEYNALGVVQCLQCGRWRGQKQ